MTTTPSTASAETSKLDYSATMLPNGDIQEVQNILGEVTTRFIKLSAQTRESAIRAGLIALGWTPPQEAKADAEESP